jgi:hypothetical protein
LIDRVRKGMTTDADAAALEQHFAAVYRVPVCRYPDSAAPHTWRLLHERRANRGS